MEASQLYIVIYGYLMYFDSKVLSQNPCATMCKQDESSAKDWIQLAPDCASLKPSWLVKMKILAVKLSNDPPGLEIAPWKAP